MGLVGLRTRLFPLGTCLVLCGCPGAQQLLRGSSGSEVPVNTADASPPTGLTLETKGLPGGEVGVHLNYAPAVGHLPLDQSALVYASAEDPEGLKEIAIWGTDEHSCIDSQGTAAKTGPGLAGGRLTTETDPTAPNGKAHTQLYVSYRLSPAGCPQGTRLDSQKFVLWAEASNYGGQKLKGPTLTIMQP